MVTEPGDAAGVQECGTKFASWLHAAGHSASSGALSHTLTSAASQFVDAPIFFYTDTYNVATCALMSVINVSNSKAVPSGRWFLYTVHQTGPLVMPVSDESEKLWFLRRRGKNNNKPG